jgi:hypothetical protein
MEPAVAASSSAEAGAAASWQGEHWMKVVAVEEVADPVFL